MKIKAIALGFLIACGVANAEKGQIQSGITLSPMIGIYNYDQERDIDDDSLYSIGLGYQFNSPWALELVYLESETEDSDGIVDIDMKQLRLDALYHFDQETNIQPYLAFGLGENEIDTGLGSNDETIINGGMGIKVFVTPKLSLRGDFRFVNSLDEEATDIALSFGLHYSFGGDNRFSRNDNMQSNAALPVTALPVKKEKAVAINVVTDSDGDGVDDLMDKCPGSDAEAQVDRNGCYILIKEGHSIDLEVNFANDSAEVRSGDRNEIAELAKFMQDFPKAIVLIEGHTDDTGPENHNQILSEKRASAVKAFLVEQYNIDSARITSKGYGETSPLFDSSVAGYRAKNRRVVASVKVTVEKIKKTK